MTVYDSIVALLARHSVPYREFHNGPIYSYEDCERERHIHGWEGTESKSVFLTDKKGRYFLYATLMGKRVDFARMREVSGMKLSLASEEEVRSVAMCIPWNVPPFGLPIPDLVTYVDPEIFTVGRYLFSPWVPDRTIEAEAATLKGIFEAMGAMRV